MPLRYDYDAIIFADDFRLSLLRRRCRFRAIAYAFSPLRFRHCHLLLYVTPRR